METQRLDAVRELDILDTEPEAEFDELASLAASICGTPFSSFSVLDEHRQWFKAKVGFDLQQTTRRGAFCDHTIRQDDPLIVEDATQDERFAGNPMVAGGFGIRFYAGFPVKGRSGHKVGTLCVSDVVPRQLLPEQEATLKILAAQVTARLELRHSRRHMQRLLAEKTELLAQVRASEELFRTFMQHSPMACFIKDEQGRFVYYNQKLASYAGVTPEACLGKTDEEMWPPALAASIRKNDRAVLEQGEMIELCETTSVDANPTHWRSFKFPWRNAAGDRMLAGIALDVTQERLREGELQRYQSELEEANARLRQLSLTDPLTGLGNRRALSERLAVEARRAREDGLPVSLLTIDVDHFKRINDRFGHSFGDTVLRGLAGSIARSIRMLDFSARFGGEEFAVLIPGCAERGATAVARRIHQELAGLEWPCGPVTVSIGVATVRPGSSSAEDLGVESLVHRSDLALYGAKSGGRNRTVVHGEDVAAEHELSGKGRGLHHNTAAAA